MINPSIGIIGAGNMGLALASGLAAGGIARDQLWVSDPNAYKRQTAGDRGATATPDNEALIKRVDVLVLAVKPQQMQALCQKIGPQLSHRRPLLVSVAAGVRVDDIDRWLGGGLAIVRAMPNTPALILAGTTVLFANPQATEADRHTAERVLKAVSEVFWVTTEDLMDAATAVSGSGPAYLFLFIEALTKAGMAAGLPAELSSALAHHTVNGAARMACASSEDVALLRQRVTSPGGTTEQAINSLLQDGFMETLTRAVRAATARSRQLGEQLGV